MWLVSVSGVICCVIYNLSTMHMTYKLLNSMHPQAFLDTLCLSPLTGCPPLNKAYFNPTAWLPEVIHSATASPL